MERRLLSSIRPHPTGAASRVTRALLVMVLVPDVVLWLPSLFGYEEIGCRAW